MDNFSGFLPGIVKYRPQTKSVGLRHHGCCLDFIIVPKLSKIPLILSEFRNKNKHGSLHEVVQAILSR